MYNSDKDMVVIKEALPAWTAYHMLRSKFCIQADGNAPWSPRLMQYMLTGCVPVIVSDKLLPPFHSTLNWTKFSVHITVSQLPDMKRILLAADHPALLANLRIAYEPMRFTLDQAKFSSEMNVLSMLMYEMWNTLRTPEA